jgi:hypothetical protein
MGFRSDVRRSTLAEANELRDWRIYADWAQSLIRRARKLYATEPFALELDQTVYALDATVIDLCLSLFPWAHFRSTKAAIKLHTLLDLRGSIPTFLALTTGAVHEVNLLDDLPIEPGAIYVMDRGYLDFTSYTSLGWSAKKGEGFPDPAPLALREATESEVGRIKGEALLLAEKTEAARAARQATYERTFR